MNPSLVSSEVSVKETPLDNSDRESSTINAGPSDAEKPFNASAKADVILRSSDSVDFFVLKVILCLTSPVFDHMFSVTQESNEGESMNETRNGLPVVDLAEDSTTLYNLLLLLYPYAKKPTHTLEVYTRVTEAAQKYVMDETLQKLKELVMSCGMVEEPLATFSVAVHFGWVEVMKEAALNSLAIPLRDLVSDGQSKYLPFISLADYRHLLSWRLACIDVLDEMFASWKPDEPYWGNFGPHLLRRLKETGCPRGSVLMADLSGSDEAVDLVYSHTFTKEDIEDIRESMMEDIENALSKVPLEINGIVVQAGD